MKSAHKRILGILTAIGASLFLATNAQAGLLKNAKITPADTRPSQSTTHTFQFSSQSSTALEEILISYCTTASGTCTAGQVGLGSVTLANQSGALDGTWTLSSAASSIVTLRHPSGDDTIAANAVMSFDLANIDNHSIAGPCVDASNNSSSTCYVRIQTYSNVSQSGAVDNTSVTVTVVEETTVTATVDPTFTFVVGAVNSGIVSNQITTSVSSTYSSLPFGNLTASTPKYAAHTLTVTTNTQGGYTVTSEMRTQMTGVYTANNIDPYAGGTWNAPTAWTEPTGTTANVNTAWVGGNTSDDTDISQFGNGLFGPISGTANTVSTSTSSDNGSTATTVMYVVEANVYQPADQYTGALQYTAVPTY